MLGSWNYRIKPNLPRIGKQLRQADPADKQAASRTQMVRAIAHRRSARNITIRSSNSVSVTLTGQTTSSIETSSAEGYACGEDGGYLTALDTSLDDDLVKEGLARELVRTVQEARKNAGLEVADRIVLGVSGAPAVEDALTEYRDFLMAETLATEWQVGQALPQHTEQRSLDDDRWTIEISKS